MCCQTKQELIEKLMNNDSATGDIYETISVQIERNMVDVAQVILLTNTRWLL